MFNMGFVLPFTMLISALILFIVSGAMTRLSKQFYFSKIQKQSNIAYYAADDAVACIISVDDAFVGADGLGIFPSSATLDLVNDANTYINDIFTYVNNQRTSNGQASIPSINDIRCASVSVFDPSLSGPRFTISPTPYQYNTTVNGLPVTESGVTVSTKLKMDIGGGNFRCALVTVHKTLSFRQVISQGYADCDNTINSIERAVVSTVFVQ